MEGKVHVGFWVDVPTAKRLQVIAKQLGVSVSKLLTEAVQEIIKKNEHLSVGIVIDEETAIKFFGLSKEEVKEELLRGGWGGVSADSVCAYAIAWAQKKYPGRRREIGIFASVVDGFATGLWSGFGQDEDPLFKAAQDEVVRYVGGIPASKAGVGFLPFLDYEERTTITKDVILLLEKVIFHSETG